MDISHPELQEPQALMGNSAWSEIHEAPGIAWEPERSIALIDELTQLYNRNGFICAGSELLAVHGRRGPWAFLLSLQVDHLKFTRHCLGHEAGDSLLTRTAMLLQQVFRQAAVIGRLGDDEFAVLARVASASGCSALLASLNEAIDAANSSARGLCLCLAGGFSQFDARHPLSINERLSRAATLKGGAL